MPGRGLRVGRITAPAGVIAARRTAGIAIARGRAIGAPAAASWWGRSGSARSGVGLRQENEASAKRRGLLVTEEKIVIPGVGKRSSPHLLFTV